MTLQVMPAPYQFPAAVSREVLLPAAGGLLIIGGLTPSGTSTSAVTSLDPVTGGTRPAGRLGSTGTPERPGGGLVTCPTRTGWTWCRRTRC